MGPYENVLVTDGFWNSLRVSFKVKLSFTVFDHCGHLRQLSIVSVPPHSPAATFFYYWTHALRGSYEFGSVRPSVRPFFITVFFSELGCFKLVFFIFCKKLKDHKYAKLTEPNFLGKLSISRKWTKMAQLVHLSVTAAFFSGLDHWLFFFFLIFYMKLGDHNYSKPMEPNFLEKFLLVRKQAQKAQNGPIYLFVHYGSIFLRIGSLDLSHILHKVEGRKCSKLREPSFFEKILARLKKGQNNPKCWNDSGLAGGGSLQRLQIPSCIFHFGLFF